MLIKNWVLLLGLLSIAVFIAPLGAQETPVETPATGEMTTEEDDPHKHHDHGVMSADSADQADEAAPGLPAAADDPAADEEDPHRHHRHQDMSEAADEANEAEGIGVDELLGDKVPLELGFRDEQGRMVTFGEMLSKPTVVLPVYYTCPQACQIMLGNLASAINDIPLELGEEYRVIALSFDPDDGLEQARKAKRDYGEILDPDQPAAEWSFLTGDEADIKAFTEAIGYRYQQTGPGMFLHPNVMVALAPDGTIIRYLYGPRFLPFDIGMALTEAAKGTPGMSVRKLLTMCFSYEPTSKTYVFRSFRLIAAAMILILAVFFIIFLRRRPGEEK
jgi:protein SCO1/2